MTSLTFNFVFKIHHAFLCDTNHTAWSTDTGEYVLNNSAAFVNNKRNIYIVFFKIVNDIDSASAIYLFASRKGKIHVRFRYKSVRHELFCG